MAIVTVFSATNSSAEEVVAGVAQRLAYRSISDQTVLAWAAEHFGISREKLERVLYGHWSVLGKLTHEMERSVACMKEAIAESVKDDDVVHHGFLGHLLPGYLSHVLKVCLVADRDFRVARAAKTEKVSDRQALRLIRKQDLERTEWTKYLFEKGPWDKRLYDIKIPMHTASVENAVKSICDQAQSPAVHTKPSSLRIMQDFLLAAKVNTALVEQGHNFEVTSRNGEITIVVNKYVLRMDHLRDELSRVAGQIPGVTNVQVRMGPDERARYAMSKQEYDVPAKVLLVDDEREFVQTLSERLQMRDIGTATVYNGEEALSLIEKDEPEVMILDLRMPGIDGIEVLRQVKRLRPRVEVIILTGHGTEQDEQLARELGAFAYLEKPVDIEKLTKTLQEAYRKIKEDREIEGRRQT